MFGGHDGPASLNVADLDGSNGFRISISGTTDPVTSNTNWSAGPTLAVGLGDFNGDGLADVAVAKRSDCDAQNTYGYTYDYKGNPVTTGTGWATPNHIFVIFGTEDEQGAVLVVRDMDSDERLQIAGLTGRIVSLEVAGDVNGDGAADLILNQTERYVGSYSTASYDRQAGDRPVLGYVVFGGNDSVSDPLPELLDVRDLDGEDGYAVLGVRLLSGYSGFYGEGGYYGQSDQIRSEIVSLGDIDGDGVNDILIRSSHKGTVTSTEQVLVDPDPDVEGDEYYSEVTTYTTSITRSAEVLLSDNDAADDGVVNIVGGNG